MSDAATVTRRSVLAVGAAGLLAGCGSSRSASTANRTVDSARGRVAVPARAERVVCLDLSKIERMLDVGVRPVGAPSGWQPLPGRKDWYDEVAKTGTQAAIDVERVAALRPDLILGTPIGVNDRLYAKLRQIAPTVLLNAPGAGSQWPTLSARDADAAGRTAELVAVRDRYRRRVAAVRRAHAEVLRERVFGLAYGLPSAAYAFTRTAGMGEVLTDVGARLGRAAHSSGVAVTLSYEQLSRLGDADVVLTDAEVGGGLTAGTRAMVEQATFRALPAAKAKHVYPLSYLLVFSYGEALALLDQLDNVLGRLG